MLKNRIYLGELNHQGHELPGEHPPSSTPSCSTPCRQAGCQPEPARPAQGQVRRAADRLHLRRSRQPMSPSHAVKKGVRYRYYVSTAAIQGRRAEAGSIARVPAAEIETLVARRARPATGRDVPDDAQAQRDLFKQLALRVNVSSRGAGAHLADAADEQQHRSRTVADHAQRPDDRRKQHSSSRTLPRTQAPSRHHPARQPSGYCGRSSSRSSRASRAPSRRAGDG